MCGITGIINFDGRPVRKSLLEQMTNVIRHRGPDDEGYFIEGNIGLGHRRLSIIDLSHAGHQPMSNEDGSLWLVFNGEIYNYLELIPDLKSKGHIFKSRTDAEVVLHAYEEYGHECLNKFNGMWAFAIWDKREKKLFCSRDRFGVKPFYYYLDNNKFIFASEIKAIIQHPDVEKRPNNQTIYNYLSSGYGYVDTSENTFFKGIKQLKPAHFFELSLPNPVPKYYKYWDLHPENRLEGLSDKDYANHFYELLQDSIKIRLRSDVPVGIGLSGGLDSSSITCVVSKLLGEDKFETFSSCFDETQYDEREFIRPVLEKTNALPNFVFPSGEELFDILPKIIWHQDEPYSGLSIFAQWKVMEAAKNKGIKVLLNGQGGDETLAGYHQYYFYFFSELFKRFEYIQLFKELELYSKNNGYSKLTGIKSSLKILMSRLVPREVKDKLNFGSGKEPEYLNKDFANSQKKNVFPENKYSSILNNALYNALKISPIPSLLHIDDRNSMAFSIESRSPFLDYRLVEFLFSLPASQKIKHGQTKYVLRNALKGILPEKVRLRKDKMGFATPAELWFRTKLKGQIHDIFKSQKFLDRPYFDQKNTQKKFRNFIDGKDKNCNETIWSWLNLELWFRDFIDA